MHSQQIDANNYEMVNVLSIQITIVLNSLVQTTFDGFQKLAYQMV